MPSKFLHCLKSFSPLAGALTIAAGSVFISGCSEPKPMTFEPNLVHSMKYELKEGIEMEQASKDAFWIVTEMFGTPEQPKLPEVAMEDEDFASLVSLDNLMMASGPADAEGRGLYQKHCAICHGISGDGRGSSSAILNPYPRDYRKGIFKFKSTERGEKPTREDLATLIKNGIQGTAMVALPKLTDEQIEAHIGKAIDTLSDDEVEAVNEEVIDQQTEALTDYVIYLSWRGELERTLIDDAIFELDLEGGDRIINPAHKNSADEEEKELFEEGWEIAEDYALEIADAWLAAPDAIVEVPEPPADLPVADNYEEFVAFQNGEQAEALAESIKRGQELYVGKIALCSKCHGVNGLGDGQTTDFDDWTKEWTLGIGIKPENRDALIPLLARGALPPINAKPRNFTTGLFHGGGTANDLYIRITQGIEGSPMPAATFVDGEFEEDDVWHLINYLRSLQTPPEPEEESTEEPKPTEVAIR
ncbi:cytochrome c [Rhodopirellula baltica]|uniref:Cytochrome c class I n=1 Tax=Rhodopirellula baltica WH47 TaxID=991778 RepID=F2B281_RHOBT|nr:cytochrome c [Rhodopirellula baltica]EGF23969.1 cytochrome c class I [Rhodopirellula baltica WH47]